MTYQVVNPTTGEIAMMCSSEGKDAEFNLKLCREAADKFHEQDNQRWDVVEIKTVYTRLSDTKQ